MGTDLGRLSLGRSREKFWIGFSYCLSPHFIGLQQVLQGCIIRGHTGFVAVGAERISECTKPGRGWRRCDGTYRWPGLIDDRRCFPQPHQESSLGASPDPAPRDPPHAGRVRSRRHRYSFPTLQRNAPVCEHRWSPVRASGPWHERVRNGDTCVSIVPDPCSATRLHQLACPEGDEDLGWGSRVIVSPEGHDGPRFALSVRGDQGGGET